MQNIEAENKKDRLSVCLIGQGLSGGGIERAITGMANYFSDNGLRVSLLMLFKTDVFYELRGGVACFFPKYNKCNKYIYALRSLFYIRKRLEDISPDVVISFNEWYNPFVLLASSGMSIPVFVSDRMSPDIRLTKINKYLKRLLYPRSAGVFVQTKYAYDSVSMFCGKENIHIIPNPVNSINFQYSNEKRRMIVSLGRLSIEKGHRYLIEAFSMLDTNAWELNIIGDGPERESLEKLAHNSCQGKKVVFWGHLKKFEDIMAQAQIFVLPSLTEGFPNALVEAMSVPMACIATRYNDGVYDIVEDGVNALLVNKADSFDLLEKIRLLINNKELMSRLRENALFVREKYSFDNIARIYYSHIKNYR